MTTEKGSLLDNDQKRFAKDVTILWTTKDEAGVIEYPSAELLPHLNGTTTFIVKFTDGTSLQVTTQADVMDSADPTVTFYAVTNRR